MIATTGHVIWQGTIQEWKAAHSDTQVAVETQYRIVRTAAGKILVEQHDGEDALGVPRWNQAAQQACWGIIDELAKLLEQATA